MVDLLCLIWTIVLSVALLFLLYAMWRAVRHRFCNPLIFDLVIYYAILKILLYFLAPALLRCFSDWQYEREINATPVEVATVYGIEFISYGVWMLSILLVTQSKHFKRMARKLSAVGRFANITSKARRNIWRTFQRIRFGKPEVYVIESKIFVSVLSGLYFILSFSSLKDSFESVAGVYFVQPAVMMAGPVVGLYLFALGRKRVGNLLFSLGLLLSILTITYGLATGIRGQVAGVASWLFFLFIFVQRNRYVLYAAIAGALAIAVLQGAMLDVRSEAGHLDRSPIERIQSFVAREKAMDQRSLFDSMEFRFGEASRLSVAFLRLAHAGDYAYLEPIKSALYAPLPRRFFEDKPQPGSVDGTTQGMGMYVVQDVMRNESWNMSDFFTGMHAYWELGMLGVILLSMLSGAIVAYTANSLSALNLAGLPLMMVALKPWWNEPKLWTSQIILQVVHIFFPLLVIWGAISVLIRFLRYVSGKLHS